MTVSLLFTLWPPCFCHRFCHLLLPSLPVLHLFCQDTPSLGLSLFHLSPFSFNVSSLSVFPFFHSSPSPFLRHLSLHFQCFTTSRHNLSLHCLIDGESTSIAFLIKTSSSDTVGDLKTLIANGGQAPAFRDVIAKDLIL